MIKRPKLGKAGPSDSLFEDLLRPHFDNLYGRAYALTGNAEDAEDLMQELCIRVYANQTEVAALERPSAWMWRVLYRLFVDLARRNRRSPIRQMTACEAAESLTESLASDEPGPERKVESFISERRLQAAWEQLSADQQLLLTLHGIEGLSLAEIQDVTDLPIGTIKSRLHRSRIRLGKLLAGEDTTATRAAQDAGHELQRHRKSAG